MVVSAEREVRGDRSEVDYLFIDGLNEAGQSVAPLLLQASRYQEIDQPWATSSVSFVSLGKFLLGQFATVEAVEQALQSTAVSTCWGLPGQACENDRLPKLHWAVADATGRSPVIEVVNGQWEIHENTVHTMDDQ